MEKEFDVEIKEVLSRVQRVKAESLDDAINKAMDGATRNRRIGIKKEEIQIATCKKYHVLETVYISLIWICKAIKKDYIT